ncbi:S-type pyocin family protein [Brevundimonas sp.]|uniref:S-type pyocin family protein n=1 Tax=Brevundimonas sp. TaxID=1871086 RepID=UPI0035B0B31E
MSNLRTFAAASVALLALAACDDGASAVETRERTASDAPAAALVSTAAPAEVAEPPPAMTANRRETVDEKIVRLFERNGADFEARSAADYLDKVRAFTSRPPAGTERVERANGDVLLYQASTNTFAVVSRDGAPRTMFKPDDGAAYWAEQKARAPDFGRRRNAPD